MGAGWEVIEMILTKLRRATVLTIVTVAMSSGNARAWAAGPSLTVTPSTGLQDIQQVHFDAHGLPVNVVVVPRLCAAGSTNFSACSGSYFGQTDGLGDVSGDLYLEHRISDSVSCYAVSCTLTLFDLAGVTALVSTPVAFALQAGSLRRGANAVAPTAFADYPSFAGYGSTIGNDGSGWAAHTLIGVLGCRANPISLNDCDISNQQFQEVGADGLLHSAVFSIDPVLSPMAGPQVNCAAATGACVAVAYDVRNFAQSFVATPLSVVAPFTGSLTTSPNPLDPTMLNHFDGTGWQAYSYVAYEQCRVGGSCSLIGGAQVDSVGNLTFDTAVRREINDGGPWCSNTVACTIRVLDIREPPGIFAEVELLFVPLTISVSPSVGIVNGQQVTVSGTKLDPWSTYAVVQCAGAQCVDSGDTVGTDIDGVLFGTMTVSDTISDGNGWFIDCTAAPGTCSLQIVTVGPPIVLPLTFSAAPHIVTSTYSPQEYSTILTAANQLQLSASEYQRTAAWAVAYIFGVAGVTSVAPMTPSGPVAVTTNYSAPEHNLLSDDAAAVGLTLPEFQKLSAYAVAYLLSL